MQKFSDTKKIFEVNQSKEEGSEIMDKITKIINELGANFETFDPGELAEAQVKLAGYKFYLADYLATLQQRSEALKVEIKNHKAMRWGEVSEHIKAVEGKVKNKEQIENVITQETQEMSHEQILFETRYYQYRLKLSAVDDILTAVVQQIAQRKREIELSQKN